MKKIFEPEKDKAARNSQDGSTIYWIYHELLLQQVDLPPRVSDTRTSMFYFPGVLTKK